MLTLRQLCKEYRALPSQVLAEDGGLLLQLMEVDAIVREVAQAQEEREEGIDGGW